MVKQKKSHILVIKDFSTAFLPICYITIIPYFIKVMKDHTIYLHYLHIRVQSILFLMAGWLLIRIGIHIFESKSKRGYTCLLIGLFFAVLHNLIYVMIMYRGIQVPLYLYLMIRYGDLQIGFLVIGFYSNLVYLFKKNGAITYEEK